MTITTLICDKCGKEIKNKDGLFHEEFRTYAPAETHKVDLCFHCNEELKFKRICAQNKVDNEFFKDLKDKMFGG